MSPKRSINKNKLFTFFKYAKKKRKEINKKANKWKKWPSTSDFVVDFSSTHTNIYIVPFSANVTIVMLLIDRHMKGHRTTGYCSFGFSSIFKIHRQSNAHVAMVSCQWKLFRKETCTTWLLKVWNKQTDGTSQYFIMCWLSIYDKWNDDLFFLNLVILSMLN